MCRRFVRAVYEALAFALSTSHLAAASFCAPPLSTKTPRRSSHGAPRSFFSRSIFFPASPASVCTAPSPPMKLARRRWRVCNTFPVVLAAVVVAAAGRGDAVVIPRPVDCDFVCKVRLSKLPSGRRGPTLPPATVCVVRKNDRCRQFSVTGTSCRRTSRESWEVVYIMQSESRPQPQAWLDERPARRSETPSGKICIRERAATLAKKEPSIRVPHISLLWGDR